jgi:hypothetical protein
VTLRRAKNTAFKPFSRAGANLIAFREAPHVARALVISSHDQAPIVHNCERADGGVHLGNQLAAARVGIEIPHPDVAILVARNELGLVRVEDDRVHGCAALVLALAPGGSVRQSGVCGGR